MRIWRVGGTPKNTWSLWFCRQSEAAVMTKNFLSVLKNPQGFKGEAFGTDDL